MIMLRSVFLILTANYLSSSSAEGPGLCYEQGPTLKISLCIHDNKESHAFSHNNPDDNFRPAKRYQPVKV